MDQIAYYPLRFAPIFQYRLWGGRKLEHFLGEELPNGPVGEAWLLSDRDEHTSLVGEGSLAGWSLLAMFRADEIGLMGKFSGRFERFPLLLKFLDCQDILSVQVHPSDKQKAYIPQGEHGKTEGWVVLETQSDSLIYAGLTEGTTPELLKASLKNKTVGKHLHSFKPALADDILIKAGTVHTLKGVVVFEVQQNSDVTYRLSDWDRIDQKTGTTRPLQVDQALACLDYSQVAIGPVAPKGSDPVVVLNSDYFIVYKHECSQPFTVGKAGEPRVLVCLDGQGSIDRHRRYPVTKGNVYLLPAQLGELIFSPSGEITLLEIGIPT